MKKVIINGGTLVAGEVYGVQRNALELLKELDHIAEKGSIQILVPANGVRQLEFDHIEVKTASESGDGFLSKFRWNHLIFPRYVKRQNAVGVDMTLSLPLWGCEAVFICDCITEHYPQNAVTVKEKLGRRFYMIRAGRSVSHCKEIFTISDFSKRDIMETYHCNGGKISVIPCAWQHFLRIEEDAAIIEKLGLGKKPFFFSLGSRYYHKNFKWIAEAAKQNPQYDFVVAGTRKLNTSDRELENSGLANLIFTGYIKDEEIKALMKACRAFIQPSLYEGFGIPPMEAMSVGTSCIIADAASLPEIYEDSAWYIDPLKYDDIDMDKIMEKQTGSLSWVLDRYSWEHSAQMLWDKLKILL